MNTLEQIKQYLDIIDGAIDDITGGRPVEDAIGEIGATVDRAKEFLNERNSD